MMGLDFNGDGVINWLDVTAMLLLITAMTTAWKIWLKPMIERVAQFMDRMEAMATLVTTEFNVDGGATLKDAVVLLLQDRAEHIDLIRTMNKRLIALEKDDHA